MGLTMPHDTKTHTTAKCLCISTRDDCALPLLSRSMRLRFGDDGIHGEQYSKLLAVGAFSEYTSQFIFEDRSKGMLT